MSERGIYMSFRAMTGRKWEEGEAGVRSEEYDPARRWWEHGQGGQDLGRCLVPFDATLELD